MLSTSEPPANLLATLRDQPLLVVLRAARPADLRGSLERLAGLGVRHVEVAWTDDPSWVRQVIHLRADFPSLALGAASVCTPAAVDAVVSAGLAYAVSPILDPALVQRARALDLQLVPGVLSPSEVFRARELGCPLVKLFPAATVGPGYWSRLRAPLGGLPACIAAGGLRVEDVEPWLAAGVDAVALGGNLDLPGSLQAVAGLLQRLA